MVGKIHMNPFCFFHEPGRFLVPRKPGSRWAAPLFQDGCAGSACHRTRNTIWLLRSPDEEELLIRKARTRLDAARARPRPGAGRWRPARRRDGS